MANLLPANCKVSTGNMKLPAGVREQVPGVPFDSVGLLASGAGKRKDRYRLTDQLFYGSHDYGWPNWMVAEFHQMKASALYDRK